MGSSPSSPAVVNKAGRERRGSGQGWITPSPSPFAFPASPRDVERCTDTPGCSDIDSPWLHPRGKLPAPPKSRGAGTGVPSPLRAAGLGGVRGLWPHSHTRLPVCVTPCCLGAKGHRALPAHCPPQKGHSRHLSPPLLLPDPPKYPRDLQAQGDTEGAGSPDALGVLNLPVPGSERCRDVLLEILTLVIPRRSSVSPCGQRSAVRLVGRRDKSLSHLACTPRPQPLQLTQGHVPAVSQPQGSKLKHPHWPPHCCLSWGGRMRRHKRWWVGMQRSPWLTSCWARPSWSQQQWCRLLLTPRGFGQQL